MHIFQMCLDQLLHPVLGQTSVASINYISGRSDTVVLLGYHIQVEKYLKIIWQNISFYLGPYALLRNFSKFLTKFKGKLKRFKEINFAIKMMQFKVLVYLTLGSLINSLC